MFALRFLDKDMPVAMVHVRLFNGYTHRKFKKKKLNSIVNGICISRKPAILKTGFSKKEK